MWHAVAPRLARRFTVVATDLRGYGDSGKPPADPGHLTYSNREMAQDQVAVMDELGFDRFFVAGHDRGGLVAHRLALDHPDRVRGMAVLDMVPTQAFFERTDAAIATACFHWFLHAQPSPLPERLIGSNPDLYLTTLLAMLSGGGIDCFDPRALAEYRRCFRNPATLVAICEDYRAAATRDIEHDMADNGQRIACPLLLVWGRRSPFSRLFDITRVWAERATIVRTRAIDCGHFLAEEAPDEVAEVLSSFFHKESRKSSNQLKVFGSFSDS